MTFLYIGLAAVSITINLFIANISIQFRRHKDKFKIVKHLENELDSEADCETTPLTRDIESNKDSDGNHSPENNNAGTPEQPAVKEVKELNDVLDSRPKRKTSRVRFQTDE